MKNPQQKWICISNCGSCCRLAPDERIEALELLSQEQRNQYLSLAGSDGWCKNYDKSTKKCLIYDNRPDFCKVENLSSLLSKNSCETNSLAIEFCKQNIRSIYGGRSKTLKRYKRKIRKS